jgi:hypothetical protein
VPKAIQNDITIKQHLDKAEAATHELISQELEDE